VRTSGWRYLLDAMVAAEKYPVPEWFLDCVLSTDTGPWFAYTEARPQWNWSPSDALPKVRAPTLIVAGELEDPEDGSGEEQRPSETSQFIPKAPRLSRGASSSRVLY
jgi:hypothetical protein